MSSVQWFIIMMARLQGGSLRLQKGAGRDCAWLRGKLQWRSWKQLNLSNFAALKVHLYLCLKNLGSSPKTRRLRVPAWDAKPESRKGRPKRLKGVKILFENEPDGVNRGAFQGKSRLKKKENSHPSAHHTSEIVVSVNSGTATKEDLFAVTKALIEAKLSQQGPVDGAPHTQIRETSLEEGKVVVKVWDKASKNFAIKAVNKGGQYKAMAQKGRLRMAFTVTALFADTSPESLMALLLRQNPGLPSGALLFVSRVRSSGGGWSIFVDVDRRGLGYLRGRGNKLSALMEMVHLRPAEK